MRGEIRLTQRPSGAWLISYCVHGVEWWSVQCRTHEEALRRIEEIHRKEATDGSR